MLFGDLQAELSRIENVENLISDLRQGSYEYEGVNHEEELIVAMLNKIWPYRSPAVLSIPLRLHAQFRLWVTSLNSAKSTLADLIKSYFADHDPLLLKEIITHPITVYFAISSPKSMLDGPFVNELIKSMRH